ncbi:recombinase family protein [Salegentibacter sp. Hel_I_6]|uniref:recombinase family protein n=1 Tax=Salegentibacter sp. Hel_I_6 TaxID=1250278 RepID=UPI000AD34A5C|nr:recombinase family protein [Salegentibacter sp. Hel_I_6]
MEGRKIADLYIRVSTDEQADKGYSQRNQEEVLRKYCLHHSIAIRNVTYEDHSAKSFDRPQWKKLIAALKRHKGETELILFTKWDRFSRNAGDAYQMIGILRRLGVEPQAIEQPLDLSIPENKMMLAFYLAAPEVENDRRALNTFHGMRRARKEGRYMGLAPIGYVNKITEDGRKYIAREEPGATILKWAFTQLSRGDFNTEQVWKMARKKGLDCSKNAFWQAIRNPLYCGKIFIPRFQDEQSYFVRGQHEAVIAEELFQKVQNVLDGRGREYRTKLQSHPKFPLRGFLLCPRCGRKLTASTSKGRNKYYSYYHCSKGCPHRIKTEKLMLALQMELKKYVPRKEILGTFEKILIETYYDLTGNLQMLKRQKSTLLKDYKQRIEHIMDLLAREKIDALDYQRFKSKYEGLINQLDEELKTLKGRVPDIDGLLSRNIQYLLQLDKIIKEEDHENIRSIVHLMYPHKLMFHGHNLKAEKSNEILKYVYHYKHTGFWED